MILHGFFRSTASWRVRIALNLKAIPHEDQNHHLRRGEQRAPGYLGVNPQGLVPALVLEDGRVLTQSLAICEYLDEIQPTPPLLPTDPVERAQVRAFAQLIACDVHPVQNLKILERLRMLGLDEAAVQAWARQTIDEGLSAAEALLHGRNSRFAFGEAPTLAEICLVPQLANARRFGLDPAWPRLLEIEAACQALDAFRAAAPERQPDAE